MNVCNHLMFLFFILFYSCLFFQQEFFLECLRLFSLCMCVCVCVCVCHPFSIFNHDRGMNLFSTNPWICLLVFFRVKNFSLFMILVQFFTVWAHIWWWCTLAVFFFIFIFTSLSLIFNKLFFGKLTKISFFSFSFCFVFSKLFFHNFYLFISFTNWKNFYFSLEQNFCFGRKKFFGNVHTVHTHADYIDSHR